MNTTDEFKQSGYTVLRNIVTKDEATRLYEYTLKNLEHGNKDDGQVPGSPSFYQDQEVIGLQQKLLPQLQKAIQLKLAPVFCYHRVYRTGAILRIHKDSSRAEISTTINLGQKDNVPWDLWLVDYNENPQKISLAPGDALIYHGSKLHHWRGKLAHTDLVSQIMFHFVDANGKHKLVPKMEIIRKIRKRFRKMMGIAY